MSRRPNAPYKDHVEEDGRILIYEGHDVPQRRGGPNPKSMDQSRTAPRGKLTQNGLFERAALRAKEGTCAPEIVAVYEKIHAGIWAFNGMFKLSDAWVEHDGKRNVFKFQLELTDSELNVEQAHSELGKTRVVPSAVKLEVWKRDKGKCVLCGSSENLHFDHELPYSKGGTSFTAENIRILCARHNLAKRDKIE